MTVCFKIQVPGLIINRLSFTLTELRSVEGIYSHVGLEHT